MISSASMRARPDRRLDEPSRSWNVGVDTLSFVVVALALVALGLFLLGAATHLEPEDGWRPVVSLVVSALAVWTAAALLARRGIVTSRGGGSGR